MGPLKIDDAQDRRMTCPEVADCLSVSLLSLEDVQMTIPDYSHKLQRLKTGEMYLAVCCSTSFQFQLEIVGFDFFF